MESGKSLLSKENSLVLRGVAILFIMYHNLLHVDNWGFCTENEMSFVQEKADAFKNVICTWNSSVVFEYVSFLGWIGVPVFVFLTGYGLAAKYPHHAIKTRVILGNSYLKLIFLLLPAVLFFFIFDIKNEAWEDIIKRIIYFSMLTNFDYPNLRVNPGVYWYFSLTFQYYVIFLCFRKYLRPINLLIMSVVSLFLLYILTQADMPRALSIYRHCFPGWFPLFAIGVWFADNLRVVKWIERLSLFFVFVLFVVLSVLVILMNNNVILWVLVPIVSLFKFILLGKMLISVRYVNEMFRWIGSCSAFIFVVHPIARQLVYVNSFHIVENGVYVTIACYTLLTFVIAYFYKKSYDFLFVKYITSSC